MHCWGLRLITFVLRSAVQVFKQRGGTALQGLHSACCRHCCGVRCDVSRRCFQLPCDIHNRLQCCASAHAQLRKSGQHLIDIIRRSQ